MAASTEINVALPNEMIAVVRQAIEEGEYATPSEVVEDALRNWTATRSEPYDMEHLRGAWFEALADDSEGESLEEVFNDLEIRYQSLVIAAGTRAR